MSSLAPGPRGWIQAGNFALAGTLFLAGAAGLARAGDPAAGRAAPALIGAAGAGLIGSAVFTTDPVSGYLPGTPDALTHATRTGMAHNLAAVPVFVGPPGAGSGAGYGQSPRFIYLGGLFQRTSIITGLAWLTALSAQALRQRPAIAAPRHQAG